MRWNITAEQRQQVVEKLMALVAGDDYPICIRACRLLIAMEQQNAKDDDDPNENRFLELWSKIQSEN